MQLKMGDIKKDVSPRIDAHGPQILYPIRLLPVRRCLYKSGNEIKSFSAYASCYTITHIFSTKQSLKPSKLLTFSWIMAKVSLAGR